MGSIGVCACRPNQQNGLFDVLTIGSYQNAPHRPTHIWPTICAQHPFGRWGPKPGGGASYQNAPPTTHPHMAYPVHNSLSDGVQTQGGVQGPVPALVPAPGSGPGPAPAPEPAPTPTPASAPAPPRSQISDFRFQISDFRFQISEARGTRLLGLGDPWEVGFWRPWEAHLGTFWRPWEVHLG